VEAEAIRALVDAGVVVVATGGGGVPVVVGDGGLEGVAAVVDKDLASALLAIDLRAEALIVLTDVDHVFVGYGTSAEEPLSEVTVEEARALLARGEFPAGSMGPKVEALCRFVEKTGGLGVITSIDLAERALEPGVGTTVVP
jgi:carbamate kinase